MATPLNTAARNGNIELVKLLLERSADVNLPNLARVTPLMSAVYGGHTDVARTLLAAKASVEPRDRMEKTAMIYAAGNGNAECVAALRVRASQASSAVKHSIGASHVTVQRNR